MTQSTTSTLASQSAEGRSAKPNALFAAALGAFILFVVGFAQPEVLHNAAHDTRHALGAPCH